MDWIPVTCPTCFETFEVPPPDTADADSQLDYDCEVCCRPMVLQVTITPDGQLDIEAQSLDA